MLKAPNAGDILLRFWLTVYATLCGDRAFRRRGMQVVALLRFLRNHLRRSKARNAGDCVFGGSRATLCGDRARQRFRMRVKLRFCILGRLLAHMAHVHSFSGTVCG